MSETTPLARPTEELCVIYLMARTGWGKNQATAFVEELTRDERQAIVTCGLSAEHAACAPTLLQEISDNVLRRRAAKKAAANQAAEPAPSEAAPPEVPAEKPPAKSPRSKAPRNA